MSKTNRSRSSDWPEIPFPAWAETAATLHMWSQIVGKIRLEQTPWTNHSWHVPLYVTARGLGTSLIPHGARAFEIDFDFRGPFAALGPIMRRRMQKSLGGVMVDLKAEAERRAA